MDITKTIESENTMKDTQEKLYPDKTKSETIQLSHHELIKLTKVAIDNIIESDPLLSGLPSDVTIEELKSQIAVAQGQAITLFLNRGELPKLAVVVPPHDTTVLDLKKAIKRHMSLSLKRENIKKKISWKHIWKKYHLCFEHIKLANNNENIKTYGIANKAELHFMKKRREKNKLVKN
ncbi:U11/U12 small nuclear ribonucleoprotein 25 kDa protein [Harpegnathos saltator]|uniref:U11/U12 small nuclear ribonucleoprotein 25 kDa protein n=1 Tax=Harpegnathos saltator TaxID=610380 RepID=E2BTZ2_HARSA|nr:U11/U12 small nuclear ribonucleoprotein 25 kDa protein [Harpegnathos saltator]XP_011145044.1 U11/U12 small nuclear ribonucleoprotein 25 kDa protein [Harpegnathos saltator]EFN80891.1 U11/U12 small nuclear ribonucleoprotein 25 kDa protein [Harpegnathos saltator]